ncbi:ribose 5-phosphate isomerase A family protein [Saccharata proteae CBS 121410]|uniref:Ribose-5-phosphate isomerase n=1 Tax=Saccharata proteae CBS 121410 TaxID=1314787 RepID=A0A9P4I0L2_9PEZI|nr:ribose 5-phosphate isomerase A family protein [Saccharata proteae CBS 121410]
MPELSVEDAKRQAAVKAVEEHFDPAARYVGIGSGSTIIYVVEAIKAASTNDSIQFVPTGYQSRQVIVEAGLTPIAFDSLPQGQVLDVAFDGADEVDEELNCIKGGGACLFQEKLVAERAKKFICVADYRKAQPRLLTNWPSIPIEVAPLAAATVTHALRQLGSPNPKVRVGPLAKTGPVKTDQDFFIIDAPFPKLLTQSDIASASITPTANGPTLAPGSGKDGVWEVSRLSREIKRITGVLEVGLFCGEDGHQAQARGAMGGQRPVAVYFGMQDGSVMVRHAKKE